MKTLVSVVCVVFALVVVALPAGAANGYAGTVLTMQPIFSGGSYQPVFLGWYTDQGGTGIPTTDGCDLSDMGNPLIALDGMLRFDLAPITGAPADFGVTNGDFRAPNASEKLWSITAQIQTNEQHVGGVFGVNAWFISEYGPGDRAFYIFDGNLSADECKARVACDSDHVVKMTQATMTWKSSANHWTMPAPTSSTVWDPEANDGQGGEVTVWGENPTMHFTVYTPAVPEPSSIFALVAGLAGFVGFGIRMRR